MSGHEAHTRAGRAWAILLGRLVLGLIFFMAGWFKVFEMGPVGHVEALFLPYSDTFLPVWSLWAVGITIPFVELVGGFLLMLGWKSRWALLGLAGVLVTVTFGHLLDEALFDLHHHVMPRLLLVLFLLVMPAELDRFSVDAWRRRQGTGSA